MTKLKPCPFCGCKDVGYLCDFGVVVTCLRCSTEGPWIEGPDNDENRGEAATLWNNRRPEFPEPSEVLQKQSKMIYDDALKQLGKKKLTKEDFLKLFS